MRPVFYILRGCITYFTVLTSRAQTGSLELINQVYLEASLFWNYMHSDTSDGVMIVTLSGQPIVKYQYSIISEPSSTIVGQAFVSMGFHHLGINIHNPSLYHFFIQNTLIYRHIICFCGCRNIFLAFLILIHTTPRRLDPLHIFQEQVEKYSNFISILKLDPIKKLFDEHISCRLAHTNSTKITGLDSWVLDTWCGRWLQVTRLSYRTLWFIISDQHVLLYGDSICKKSFVAVAFVFNYKLTASNVPIETIFL
ncbi:hypothetical protein PHYBLDRAFT_173819 [Phycomyces blakesleeanus NRRL 1555(-)]|uniref:Uncharacterized protein n=1 Tax=Phycomyces blakesleeanus (strain ATCC 8743b / DSM 1359 / FGSC 10004 / NBRC 33097 / NRRL 1555) TaxID=763407 RepID=A0A167KEI2_PHYB8|nr:hypothetical protein PHYBLDRAFT_173819 [Phycomyces blakesleeanus NRRL 1555(-)]OAD67909.1 hypothetical protein PHYBLDRAFT_173819 [Phycomyces blakesleeanus NRRL 1555(-)]|eukprot:XP_018285949.1 hypothetical protein PHYBLDRAFT_173819 [Phycomyces blakesleeanus NRRL 1555(-)]